MIHDKGWEIACRPWEDATVAERTEWTAILAANPSLYSPFLQPAFLDAAVAAGRNVETAVMRHAGGSRGFWAFERRGRWDAHPVAEGFSEGQAVVIASDAPRWNMADVLRACGLRRWRFDHAPVEQTELRRFATRVGPSPYADLSDGWDAFLLRQRAAGVKSLHESLRKLRKLQKEHGSVAFQANAGDNAFECLLRWKSDQHSRTGVPDVFENRDVVRLLDEVRRQRDSHFAGELAAPVGRRATDRCTSGSPNRRRRSPVVPGLRSEVEPLFAGNRPVVETSRAPLRRGRAPVASWAGAATLQAKSSQRRGAGRDRPGVHIGVRLMGAPVGALDAKPRAHGASLAGPPVTGELDHLRKR